MTTSRPIGIGRSDRPSTAASRHSPSLRSLQPSTTITVFAADAGVLDAITIAGETQGASRRVKLDALNTIDNDDAGARCVTPAGNTYGPTANLGTPGAANVACP